MSGCGVSPQAVTEASRLRPSPPQVDPHKPVSDVWSFAASLYSLLTGKFPFPSFSISAFSLLPERLAATIDNALVRNPKARIPDAGKLLAAVQ